MRALLLIPLLLAAPAAADGWKKLGTFDGTQVERLENKSGPPTLRCTYTFSAPLERVKAVFTDLPRWSRWMNAVKTWKILSRDDERRVAFAYGRHTVPWPLKDRDYVVRLQWEETADRFVVRSQGVKGKGPDTKGKTVRLLPRATWDLRRAGEGKTLFVYTYKGGAGGNLPNWMIEGSYKSEGPKSIRKIIGLVHDNG